MIKDEKCVEYYFDSHKYNKMQIIEYIEREKVAFENKKFEMNIKLNEHGIYVVKLNFLNNKLVLFKKKISNNKEKVRKTYKGYETYNGENKVYGKYKSTGVFQPI